MDLPTDEELRYLRGMYDNSMSLSTLMEWWKANGSQLMITWIREGFHKSGSNPDALSPELVQLLGIDVSQSGPAVPAPSEEEYAVLSVMIEGYASQWGQIPFAAIEDRFIPYSPWDGVAKKPLLREHLSPDSQGRTAEDDLRAKRRGTWPVEARLNVPIQYTLVSSSAHTSSLSLHRVGFGAGGLEAMTGFKLKWVTTSVDYLAVFHRQPEGWRLKEALRNMVHFSLLFPSARRR